MGGAPPQQQGTALARDGRPLNTFISFVMSGDPLLLEEFEGLFWNIFLPLGVLNYSRMCLV